MKKWILFNTAFYTLLFINSLVIVFHILVLLKIIPYNLVWAGRIKSDDEMYAFESLSLILNSLLMLAALVRAQKINFRRGALLSRYILLGFTAVFALNTVGNLFAASPIEKWTATPLTFILTLLCLRLFLSGPEKAEPS